MEMTEGRVIISKADYDDLIRKSFMLQIMKDILYENSQIARWKPGLLTFSGDPLSEFLRAADECRYKFEYKRLEDEDREKVID